MRADGCCGYCTRFSKLFCYAPYRFQITEWTNIPTFAFKLWSQPLFKWYVMRIHLPVTHLCLLYTGFFCSCHSFCSAASSGITFARVVRGLTMNFKKAINHNSPRTLKRTKNPRVNSTHLLGIYSSLLLQYFGSLCKCITATMNISSFSTTYRMPYGNLLTRHRLVSSSRIGQAFGNALTLSTAEYTSTEKSYPYPASQSS